MMFAKLHVNGMEVLIHSMKDVALLMSLHGITNMLYTEFNDDS